jgi:hypothetical protein
LVLAKRTAEIVADKAQSFVRFPFERIALIGCGSESTPVSILEITGTAMRISARHYDVAARRRRPGTLRRFRKRWRETRTGTVLKEIGRTRRR